MKKFSLLFVVSALFSVSSFAVPLLPASNPICESLGAGVLCTQGTELLFDNEGRCGCLSKSDYHDPQTCRISFIKCDNGSTLSSLHTFIDVNGALVAQNVGCGCFSTRL